MTTQKEMEEIRAALSWFDVRRYDGLKDLTLEQIYAELERRMLAYKSKRTARTVLTGMSYSVGSVMRQGSSSLTRLTGQSAMTSRTWRR